MRNLSNVPEDFSFPDTMSPPNALRHKFKKQESDSVPTEAFESTLNNVSHEHLASNRRALSNRYFLYGLCISHVVFFCPMNICRLSSKAAESEQKSGMGSTGIAFVQSSPLFYPDSSSSGMEAGGSFFSLHCFLC